MRNENGFGSVICLDKSGKKRRKPWAIRVIVVNTSEHKQKRTPPYQQRWGSIYMNCFHQPNKQCRHINGFRSFVGGVKPYASNAFQVFAPTMPSAVSEFLLWNCFTADNVFAPKIPSAVPHA